jgi:hypothetical protein
LSLILFQYSGSGGAQYGSWPMIGILIGIVVGMVAAAAGRSGGLWGALVGAICFAGAWSVQLPEGFDLGPGHFTQPLLMEIGSGAVSGAIWCGLWGLLGGWIGKKMRAGKGEPKHSDMQPLGLASGGTEKAAAIAAAETSDEAGRSSEGGAREKTKGDSHKA